MTVPAGAFNTSFQVTTTTVGSATSVIISGAYNSVGAQTSLTVNPGSLVSQAGWSLLFVDSQETSCFDGSGAHAFDGNSATMWFTQICSNSGTNEVPPPHEIQINLGASYNLTAFRYLPAQDGESCGWIKQYEFYVSTDGLNWGSAVASGNFDYGALAGNCAATPPALQIAFQQTTGQYIRLRALSEQFGNPWIAVAELNLLSTSSAGPTTVAQVTLNPPIVVGGTSAQGTVTLSAPAPAGGASVALVSSDPAAQVGAPLTLPANAISATFPITTVSVGSATSVDITGTYNSSSAQASLTVNPGSLISRAGWSLWSADSQESACFDGSGANAFDGNPNTMWFTQICNQAGTNEVPPPHEIQINLGASYNLTAFRYLPAQDGQSCGWIKQYEFYVSSDGVTWGSPVASGNFNYGALAGNCAAAPPALQIAFPQTTGQYIRLRGLSEQFGNPWIAAAEINVIGQ